MTKDFAERARKIKLLLMDCDGVLTDGRLYFSKNGEELKVFHVRDGQGIVSWHEAGFVSGIISGRNSPIVEKRAVELGIKYIKQGSHDKTKEFEEILNESKFSEDEIAFIGDDTADLKILTRVGLAIAVADAEEDVLATATLITKAKGGFGAAREAINLILKANSENNA